MKTVTRSHLLAAHSMTTAEYQALGHETMSAEQRARHSVGGRRIQPGEYLGSKHPRYKGGHVSKKSGYRLIRLEGKLKYEHRVVMESALGRPLARGECVHHIDGIRSNNNVDNLQLFPTQAAHIAFHQSIGQTEYGRRFTKPPRNWASQPHKALDTDYIVAQYHAGRTDADVGAEIGVHRTTIRRRLAAAGIKRSAGNHSQRPQSQRAIL